MERHLNVLNAVKGYRCFCGSSYCGQFACRFYSSPEQMQQEMEEFRKQWAAMESDDREQVNGR